MSETVIKAENLGKSYIIGHEKRERYTALRDVLANKARQIAGKTRQIFKGGQLISGSEMEEFWALKDLNFEIKQGDRVGIIGRNGAGKSTLLKVLSRITEPTTGKVKIKGRVASLLEVGTGFHPELTGRENIFLNGAILGMSRVEIRKKYDEIVDFSGVEKFLDTPVKRYSSGMYVRLAFAVAAHLEPEILVVDEVLAVGDAEFQKKALGKMQDVSQGQGRTVLFVSHNMQAIRNLCKNAFLLEKGYLIKSGSSDECVNYYLTNNSKTLNNKSEILKDLPIDNEFELLNFNIKQDSKEINDIVYSNQPIDIEIEYKIKEKVTGLRVFFDIIDNEETLIIRSFQDETSDGASVNYPGKYISKTKLPANILGPTYYNIRIQAGIYNNRMCIPEDAIKIKFKVENFVHNKAYPFDTFRSKIAPIFNWENIKIE
jgi:lipopolysaccharide transport system ATP-binding protein